MALSDLKEFLCSSPILTCPCYLVMCSLKTHNRPNIVFGSQVKIKSKFKKAEIMQNNAEYSYVMDSVYF